MIDAVSWVVLVVVVLVAIVRPARAERDDERRLAELARLRGIAAERERAAARAELGAKLAAIVVECRRRLDRYEVDGAVLRPAVETLYEAPDADALAPKRDPQEVWDVLSRRTSFRRTARLPA